MSRCGHHYPREGCHNCWQWIEEALFEARDETHVLEAVLAHLETTGAISVQQLEVAFAEVKAIDKAPFVCVEMLRDLKHARSGWKEAVRWLRAYVPVEDMAYWYKTEHWLFKDDDEDPERG